MKLDLGAGSTRETAWTTLDIDPQSKADIIADATKLAPIPDASCDHIRAAHLLEHLYHFQIADTLELWLSKLKPGGLLTLYIPDIFTEMERFLLRDDHPQRFFAIVYGQQWTENPAAIHKTGFWPERIEELLFAAGFHQVQAAPARFDTEFAITARRPANIYPTEET